MIFSYSEFKKIRRQSILDKRSGIPSFVDYSTINNGYYLHFHFDDDIIECNITDNGDVDDFESDYINTCRKVIIPDGLDIKTHDFSNNSTWVNGSEYSIYCVKPSSGKMIRVKRFGGSLDKGITFSEGQEFKVNLWESYDGSVACPSYVSGTKTSFGSPLYNPLGDPPVYTGWLKAYPDDGDVQEVEVWVYLSSNFPQYKVTTFSYSSLKDLRSKADYSIIDNALQLKFDYLREGINILLRSSLNERIEFYIDNDTAYTDPNNEGAIAYIAMHSYNEF